MSELTESLHKQENFLNENTKTNIFELINQLNIQDQQNSEMNSESKENCPNKNSIAKSKIPRFEYFVRPHEQIPAVKSPNFESSSNNSISSTEFQSIENNRTSRSVSKSNGVNCSQSSLPLNQINKRCTSVSASTQLNTSRSMSVNDSSSENLSLYNENPVRTVRYIVRHKPKESKVKIFSQKVELKNVKSKIGSLDKANHVPGGGNVNVCAKIENHVLNWDAKSKIGSLEKAASYTPSGGNVKIPNFQLNWQAKPKIGSLEKATYKPQGGNVKIESYKLDFKQKAKPKTDTGLIVIEDVNGFDRSMNSLSDHLSRSQLSFTGSN